MIGVYGFLCDAAMIFASRRYHHPRCVHMTSQTNVLIRPLASITINTVLHTKAIDWDLDLFLILCTVLHVKTADCELDSGSVCKSSTLPVMGPLPGVGEPVGGEFRSIPHFAARTIRSSGVALRRKLRANDSKETAQERSSMHSEPQNPNDTKHASC